MKVKLISIYKIKNRTYYYADYLLDGKKHNISLKCTKKQKAIMQWEIIREKIEKKHNIKPINIINERLTSITLNEALIEYINFKTNKLQSSTIRSSKWSLKKFILYLDQFEVTKTKDIHQDFVERFIDLLDDENKSNKTINNYISILSSFFNFLIKKKYLNFNPINKTHWKKAHKTKIELFNKAQARIIIERIKQIQDNSYRVMMLSPFFTGMRYSEIKALNKKNIDLINRIIHVKEKQTPDDKNPLNKLKTNAANRKIPILSEYLTILKEYIANETNDYIFANINYKTLSNLRRKLSKELRIPFRFHDGRHFFASLLINNKFDFKTIQTILGHEDISFTFNVYGHIIDELNATDFDRIKF